MGVKQDVRWKFRQIYMVDADVARLNAELLNVFPEIRFADNNYWEAQAAGDVEPPATSRLPYRPALTDTREYCRLNAWLEPKGWEPSWSPPDRNGRRFIVNEPKPLLIWTPPTLRDGSWDSYDGRNTLEHATIVGRYAPGDDDHLRLINKAWRLLRRVAVNNVELCENHLAMEAVLGPVSDSMLWIGHEALKWLYEDRRRVIWHRHRPSDAIDRAPGWWK